MTFDLTGSVLHSKWTKLNLDQGAGATKQKQKRKIKTLFQNSCEFKMQHILILEEFDL